MTTIVEARVNTIDGRVLAHLRCAGSPCFTMTIEMDRLTALRLAGMLAEEAEKIPGDPPVVMQVTPAEGAPANG